jgi:hypothetical protein
MRKNNLKDTLAKRTPLPQREVVEPVNMYTSPQVDKTTSTQMDKNTSGQVDNPTNQQVGEPTSPQSKKPAKPPVEKYTTHLRPDTIKAVKRAALESDRKDYEVVQQALDEYLKQ